MSLKQTVPFLLLLVLALAPAPVAAGWGDALRQAGDAGGDALGLPGPSGMEVAFRELLGMGTDAAVESLSADGGFSKLAATALSLPDSYRRLAETVAPSLLENLNAAAESAVPAVGELFRDAISRTDFPSPGSLLGGQSDAVTRHFAQGARPSLAQGAAPLVRSALERVGGGSILGAIDRLGALTGVAFDPVDYLTRKTLDSMFLYMGRTEQGIRSGEITATSELLQKIF